MLELVAGLRHNLGYFRTNTANLNIDIRGPEDEQWSGPRRGAISANSDDTLCLKLGIASPKVRSFR